MKNEVDLSIVIPNYNSGALLRNTLQSIYSSAVSFSFEVLIIDNQSTDYSAEVASEYKSSNLLFFSSPDSGIYDAMNKGIKRARGEWIYFLGAGDLIISSALDSFPYDDLRWNIVYGDVYLVQRGVIYDGEFSFLKLMKRNISHQAMLYRKSLLETLGGFDISFPIASDYVFNLNVFARERHFIKYVPSVLCEFKGMGISDTVRDNYFSDNKVWIISKIVFRSFSIYNLYVLISYYVYYLRNYIRFRFGWSL